MEKILNRIKTLNSFKKYLLLSFIFALINAVVLLLFYVSKKHFPDTDVYVSAIRHLSGDPQAILVKGTLIKPFYLLIGALLYPIMTPEVSLILQNVIFYFLSALIIFLIVFKLYKNEKQAFYAVVLFCSDYPLLAYGLAPLIDMGGWFFNLLSIWLSFTLIQKPDLKKAALIGAIAGLGMLFKENVAAFPIFFLFFTALSLKITAKQKVKIFCIFSAMFFVPIIILNIITYKVFSYSMLSDFIISWRYMANQHVKGSIYSYSYFRIFLEIIRVFFFGWFFVIWGIIKEFKEKNIERTKIMLALVPASLSFFLWAYPHNRMAFIAAPLLIILGSFGLIRNGIKEKKNLITELSLLSIFVVINYFFLIALFIYGSGLRSTII